MSSMRLLPAFHYLSIAGCEPSHTRAPAESLCRSDEVREIIRPEKNGRSHQRIYDHSTRGHPSTVGPPSGPGGTHELRDYIHTVRNLLPAQILVRRAGANLKASRRILSDEVHSRAPFNSKPQPITTAPKPYNVRKYCEFRKQNGHTTAKCRELKKALHELADKGQIDHFLKRGPRSLRKGCNLTRKKTREEE
ncbi:hypothetical protein Cgig2_014129 [Carnegiea gigantea]|uniref:Reverse transcriptase domain-containing protein n=1 Tax=Carnegiea gigantea TaxID=171969 RepID=A0A9Q1Q9E6_9CARY|nr:hypothetical protein Cgig2_014129 [Carnegiea gigantea]